MKRVHVVITTVLCVLGVLAASLPAFAQDATPEGSWGDGHKRLHEYGTIRELMDRNDGNCCSGEMSGECRETRILFVEAEDSAYRQPVAIIEDMPCPIPDLVKVHTDIPLPPETHSVVCAGKVQKEGECPYIYCAATRNNS